MRFELETANHGKNNGDNPNPAYLLPYELCCRSRNVGRQRIESCWRSTAAINGRSATSFRCRQSRPTQATAGAGGGQPSRLQHLWRQEQRHLSSDLGQAGCQSARGDRPISGLQQALMTIFSAVMPINDRPPCNQLYPRCSAKGPGRRPWEISHLLGNLFPGMVGGRT
jgi:hypothetical protein